MPVRNALEKSGAYLRSVSTPNAETPAEVAGNRIVSGASTIAIGGSIAAIVTHFLQPPEALNAHVVSIVIFLWQSAVFAVARYLERRRLS